MLRVAVLVVSGLGLLSAASAWASPVELVSETRSVEGRYTGRDPETLQQTIDLSFSDEPDAPFADFDSDFDFTQASGSQVSTITPLRFEIHVHSLAWITDDLLESARASSRFEVAFDVVDPTEIAIAGTMNNFQSEASFTLFQRDVPGTQGRLYHEQFVDTLFFEEILLPGEYAIRVRSESDGFFSLEGELDATVTFGPGVAIPEPGTALLIGAGMVGLAGWRRRCIRR